MAANPCPALPNELWNRVLENFRKENDLPDIWMSYRFISTAFKTAVESIFREKHLRKTWIRYELGNYYDDDDRRVILNCEFKFSHLSEDKTIATFKMHDFHEDYRRIITQRLRNPAADQSIETPRHYVQVHRELNDTPIPDLSFDYEKLELSCDWRGLYTRFFGEEQLFHKYTKAWVAEKEGWAKDMRKQVEGGQLDMLKAIETLMYAFADRSDDGRKKARKARMKHQFRDRGEEIDFDLPSDEEDTVLKDIAMARQTASMENDSEYDFDEEDEDDEDGDGDEDEDESDEWESDNSELDNEDEDIEEVEEHLESHA